MAIVSYVDLPSVGIELPDAMCKNPVHIVEVRRKPFVLARPILLILGISVIQISRYAAVLTVGKLLPFQRIAEILLNGSSLFVQQMEECLGATSTDVELGSDQTFAYVHHRTQAEATPPNYVVCYSICR